MKTFAILLLITLAGQVGGQATELPKIYASAGRFSSESSNAIAGVGATNSSQLLWQWAGSAPAGSGSAILRLRSGGETLLGGETPDLWTNGSMANVASHWINGRALITLLQTNGWRRVEQLTGKDWEYAASEVALENVGTKGVIKRHLLKVDPNLFVVCDEVLLDQPATVESGLWTPNALEWDAVREEWRLQREHSSLLIKILAPRGASQRAWPIEPAPAPGLRATPLSGLRFGTTNQVTSFSQMAVIILHAAEPVRGLGFKLLESDTAIGARVHRDGLPTLIAFRRRSNAAEANLTGMTFSAPVAVDVFRPRPRR